MRPRVGVVTLGRVSETETFIRQHVAGLPADTTLIDQWPPWARTPESGGLLPARIFRGASRALFPSAYERRITAAYVRLFAHHRLGVVLAEFGPTGVVVANACRQAGLPLVVHFHGYDVSARAMLRRYGSGYPAMLEQVAAVIAVSREMVERLTRFGARPERVHYNPCGVDCHQFSGAAPAEAPPIVLAVGRLVEKKAPQLTLQAFAAAHRHCPDAKLRMLGDGPLAKECRRLARRLGIESAVAFLGTRSHGDVAAEMRRARCLVQHSVEAPDGDREGTPVTLLEAGAAGLPVVSTRHAGIPEVVVDGHTGFLVEERDVDGMAERMVRLLSRPELAATMGLAARRHVQTRFSLERSLERLWAIIESSLARAS